MRIAEDMKLRSWGQGNHMATIILLQECGCGETVWLMTKRSGGVLTYECINPRCRSVMTVTVERTIERHKNMGRPMPDNPASVKFYENFSADAVRKALDVIGGARLKCFVCGTEGAVAGPLKKADLRVAGIIGSQLVTKAVPAMCCEICIARMARDYIVQCRNTGCTNWIWQPKHDFLAQSEKHFWPSQAMEEFRRAQIIISPSYECGDCRAIRTGWRI